MAESSVRSRLTKLFSTQVIVRRTGKNKIKVYDTSKLQSVGTRDSAYRGRYTGVHTYKSHGYYTPNTSTNFFATKLELYRDYEAMDEDPILASALDIYADESTMRSPDGTILNINSPNDKVKQILHNLFYDILNIEFNLWAWVRNACKYGDFYLALDLDEELGVVNVIPMSSYDVQRMEGMEIVQNGMNPSMNIEDREVGVAGYNPYDVKFKYEPLTNRNPFLKEEYEYYEVAHFRLLSDTNFLPYGRSMLEPARREFKRLALMEDAMMIHRVMRAPQRRVYKIAVGNLSPQEIDQYMRKIMDDTKKIPYVDEKTGQYNLKFNLENMLEDIYIPVRGGDSQTEIDTLDGLDNSGFIEDVDYIKQKMMAALKIPKAFLGYDENLEGKCISPDTLIPLLNGKTKSVLELIEDYEAGIKNYVYSLDEGTNNIVPGEIEWAGFTRLNTKVLRVHLDNKKYIDCTPDHRFLLRSGIWVEAQDLKKDDALMPLYFSNGGYKNNYTKVYHPSTGTYELVHQLVAKFYGKKQDGKVIHHIDFNSRNNNPNNLDCSMDFWEHRKFHSENAKLMQKNPNMIRYNKSEEKRLHCIKAGRLGGIKSAPKLVEWVKNNDPWNKKEDLYKNCSVCNTKFKVHHYRADDAKTCSKKCFKEHSRNIKLNSILYNEKYSNISLNQLINLANISTSFKDLETKLNIDRNTLNKVFKYHNINKIDFIFNNMPLALENKSFMQNYRQYEYEYKNHKVADIEFLSECIDTCDLTIKDYHNFGTDAGVIIHNSVLAAEDVRFARTIERIQSIFESELYKIAVIHLFLQGYSDASLIDFELSLNNPSIVYERQRVEVMTEKVNLATAMKESKLFSRKYIFENIINMSRDEWTNEEDLILRDQATQWRMDQISNEGNDPNQSGEAKGTPHAIAQMHVSKEPEVSDGGEFGEEGAEFGKEGGRPKSLTKFGTDRDKSNGRDPLGFKRTMSDTGFSSKAESIENKKLLQQLEDSFGKRTLNDILKS
jgi:hypothetical protein